MSPTTLMGQWDAGRWDTLSAILSKNAATDIPEADLRFPTYYTLMGRTGKSAIFSAVSVTKTGIWPQKNRPKEKIRRNKFAETRKKV